jgi:hypothetical protein
MPYRIQTEALVMSIAARSANASEQLDRLNLRLVRYIKRDRDPGLLTAIYAAGGISRLARSLSISQPSVSSWKRVPADRIITIERITGVHRSVLRPDLYLP